MPSNMLYRVKAGCAAMTAACHQHAQLPPHLMLDCVLADGMTSETSEADSDTLARSAHAEQDEALRQANRAKSQAQQQQQQQQPQEQRQQSAESRADQAVTVQDGRPEAAGTGQPGAAPQPPVSPFSRATVHRQIGKTSKTSFVLVNDSDLRTACIMLKPLPRASAAS